jgi:DNA primase
MNRAIPENIIDDIRARCDIVDLISSFLPMKKAGSTRWKACCPFHEEKTPSFVVDNQRQRYHCFGCGKGGDIFSFMMDREGVDFPNAIHLLAGRCGVIIPEKTYSTPQQRQAAEQRTDQRQRLYKINEDFAAWFADNLKRNPGSPVGNYLATRNLTGDIINNFGLGATPDGWDNSLKFGLQRGYSEAEMLDAGILTRNEQGRVYDRFRNRLMFPIWNEQDKVVAFSARTIEKESQGAKYVNSPETPVFRKSSILYGLAKARRAMNERKSAIMCEGQLDVIAMHRAGFTNTVAPQGTAFTDEQARILKRYTDCLYIAFDSDSAGRKATLRALELTLPLGFELRIIQFPPNTDPDTVYASSGESGIKQLVDGSVDFFEFILAEIGTMHDKTSPVGKSRIIADVIQYLHKMTDHVSRELYLNRLAETLNVRFETVFKEMNKFKSKPQYTKQNYDLQPQVTSADTANEATSIPLIKEAEETLLRMTLIDETVANRLVAELPHENISNTIIGQALHEVIRLSMDGEWQNSIASLTEFERTHNNHKLSMILLDATTQLNNDQKAKAVNDCILAINGHHSKNSKAELMQRLKNAETAEEKRKIMQELQNMIKRG